MQTAGWLAFFSTYQAAARTGFRRCLLLAVLLFFCRAQALEIEYQNRFPDGPMAGIARGLKLSGEIRPGDSARLTAMLRRQPADAWHGMGRVELAISGGDQAEALLLAETLVGLYPLMVVHRDCPGACAIVWLAGAWRLVPRGRIGLQTAPAKPVASGATGPVDAPPPYDELAEKLRNYFSKQGLPSQVYARWQAERSSQVFWLSVQDINSTGTWPPYYYDKLHARGPQVAASDESFHDLRRCVARLVISQKAFSFDALLAGVNNVWWNENKELFRNAPR